MRPLPLGLWALIVAQIEALQNGPLPTAIRKMPPDSGAKFHHSYVAFSPSEQLSPALAARDFPPSNTSIPFLPAFALSLEPPRDPVLARFEVLSRLTKRQWSCPSGTSGCGIIGYPNSCCRTGETCVEVEDTGLGPVGCCPAGSTCAGSVIGCADGSTACASDIGGGCCIPGFVCEGVGCVKIESVVPSPGTTAPPPPPPPPGTTTLTTTSTSVIDAPTPSTVVVTVIVTIGPEETESDTTSTVTRTTSIGGGGGEGAGAPYRPTSSSTDGVVTFCPTGFYACLASAGGGCCQTGRDCQTTSCPPVTMTTIVNTHGITVVVPAEGAPEATTGTCATGWFLCGSEAGPLPGCCPSGYDCGTASCSMITAGATATVAKAFPESSTTRLEMKKWMRAIMVGIVTIFMI
ncbi:hypothetical protein OQA88_1946 [Cercophora sp. LCS_1]